MEIYKAKTEFSQFKQAWKSVFGLSTFILQHNLNSPSQSFL